MALEITCSACLGFLLLRKKGEDQESLVCICGVLLHILLGFSSVTGVPPPLAQHVWDAQKWVS